MLFASDFDGTLSRGGVSDENKDAIRRFRASGGVFAVVTGRSVGGSVGIFREVDLDVPQTTELLWMLKKAGFDVRLDLFSADECAAEIARVLK